MAIFAEPKRDIVSASRAKREQLPNRGPVRREARQARALVDPLPAAKNRADESKNGRAGLERNAGRDGPELGLSRPERFSPGPCCG
jgi:hypothetical protein